jgi:hypothetical protein
MALIYPTVTHVDGFDPLPQYEIRGREVYRAVDGYIALRQYEIR